VQVIEARGLSLPSEHIMSLFGANLLTLATVTGDPSPVSARTGIEQGSMSPKWNQELVFPDVCVSHTLTLTVLNHRRLAADSPLGQVQTFQTGISTK